MKVTLEFDCNNEKDEYEFEVMKRAVSAQDSLLELSSMLRRMFKYDETVFNEEEVETVGDLAAEVCSFLHTNCIVED